MAAAERPLRVVFFKTDSGAEPVREWLKALPPEECRSIGADILTVQVRSRLKNQIARVLFAVIDQEIVLLNGFIKKQQKTPGDELTLARKRRSNTWRHYDKRKHRGSDFRQFLAEENLLDEVESLALKRSVALQIERLRKQQALSKAQMAKEMKTSRAAVDRLLDAANPSVTLATLSKAAGVLGTKIKIELLPA